MTEIFDASLKHFENQKKLLHAYKAGRFPHALMLYGPEGCGKEAFAIGVAQLLNAANDDGSVDKSTDQYIKIATLQHPDVQFVLPTPAESNVKPEDISEVLQKKAKNPYQRVGFEGKNTFIGIDTIRALKKEAGFQLYEGRKKVFIISEAESMRPEAANALLKLLEEPPKNLVLILVTGSMHRLLPTIKSRCQMLQFNSLTEDEIVEIINRYQPGTPEHILRPAIRLSGYNLKRAFEFLQKDALANRDLAIDFLRKAILVHKSQELMALIETFSGQKGRDAAKQMLWFMQVWFRDVLHLKEKVVAPSSIRNADKLDTLQKFMAFTPNADVEKIIWETEAAINELNDPRNINPTLILADLAIRLNPLLKPPSAVYS